MGLSAEPQGRVGGATRIFVEGAIYRACMVGCTGV